MKTAVEKEEEIQMNKSGHLIVTGSLFQNLDRRYKFWLLVGSILPDIFVHTYLTGHTWAASFSLTAEKMRQLEWKGRMNSFSFLKLGYILHYIEDYFTFPHTEGYTGSLSDHVRYEKELTEYLSVHHDFMDFKDCDDTASIDTLIIYLEKNHQKYKEIVPGFANDFKYIFWAAGKVACSYARIFEKNQKSAEIRKKKKAQTYVYPEYLLMHK